MTEVILKHKERQSVAEFAKNTGNDCKKLKENGEFTFVQDTEPTVVSPSEQLKIEYSYTKRATSIHLKLNLIGIQVQKHRKNDN